MSTNLSTHEIINFALQLPAAAREEVIVALTESLLGPSLDHGPAEPAGEVEAAWSDEIARRIADIDSGRMKTIPSDVAERMIRGDFRPEV